MGKRMKKKNRIEFQETFDLTLVVVALLSESGHFPLVIIVLQFEGSVL